MRFAKDFPDELIDQIQISDIVSKKVALKKKGKEFGGLCPFHNEKTPSFTVNDHKGFYHCLVVVHTEMLLISLCKLMA